MSRKWKINWKSRNFDHPEYAAAVYYLALTENQGNTTAGKAFEHLKRNFCNLSTGPQQLIIKTVEKYERNDDLRELRAMH